MFVYIFIVAICLAKTHGSISMEDSVKDLLDESLDQETGRLFNYDRGAAFNTSVAFTIPLFSFTLPGAADATNQGLDGNTFGVLAFVALFLIGGLGVAIYTTTQGGNEDSDIGRKFGGPNNHIDSTILHRVLRSIEGLPEALSVESCSKLSVCEAYSEPEKYGILSWPFKIFFPTNLDPQENITTFEEAANFGYKKEDECYYEYPCLVQPIDVVLYVKDYLLSRQF